jgi:hypothetical protein
MFNLKGFFEYPSLVSNIPDQVSTFGELSSDSRTYAKDKTIHISASAPSTSFVSFHSVRDETHVDVLPYYEELALKLGEYLFDQAVAGALTADAQVCRQLVLAEFGAVLTSFSTGRMLTNQNIWLPEFVVFEGALAGEQNRVQIWLSDDSFAGQYDEYFISVVMPIIPYDDFFKDPLVVRDLLRNIDLPAKFEEIQDVRGKYPMTYTQALQYDYVNPRDPTFKVPAPFFALIYGVAGNNPDLINDVIVNELLANSTHTREEWETILPELFRRTEFIITPLWKQYAIPGSLYATGIYSPTIDPRKNLPLIRRTARGNGYTDAWTDAQYELSSNIYRSLAFGIVGNPKNREGIVRFSAQFPDYMLVTNSLDGNGDFDRISDNTKEWMVMFVELLKAAEEMDLYTSVPKGIARMKRDGVVYASKFYKRVNYMVTTKHSVEELS